MSARTLRQIREAHPYPCDRMSLLGPHPVTYDAYGRERLQKVTCNALMRSYRPHARTVQIEPRHLTKGGNA